jgi:hypothetical protein
MGSGKRSRGLAPAVSGRSSRWSIGALRTTTCHVVASIEVERPRHPNQSQYPTRPSSLGASARWRRARRGIVELARGQVERPLAEAGEQDVGGSEVGREPAQGGDDIVGSDQRG